MQQLITQQEIQTLKDKGEDFISEIFNRTHDFVYKEGYEKAIERLKSLPVGYQTVYSTMVVEGEIHNGGFYQYFGNSTAEEFHFLAVEAFKRVGALKISALLEEVFETVLKQSTDFRSRYLVDGIQEAFNFANDEREEIRIEEFDDRFYHLTDGIEKLDTLRESYVLKSLDSF